MGMRNKILSLIEFFYWKLTLTELEFLIVVVILQWIGWEKEKRANEGFDLESICENNKVYRTSLYDLYKEQSIRE